MPDPTDPSAPFGEEPSLARQTLDMLLYAPVGLVVTAVEDLPTLAARGRSVLTQTLRNAHLIGQFTLAMGRRELEARMGRSPVSPSRTVPPAPRRTSSPAEADGPATRPGPVGSAGTTVLHPTAAPTSGEPTPEGVDLAIPGYDSLSASQVVRRLDGLGPRELEAIYHHEAAGRRRRTILHRAQQLLGLEPTPGVPDAPL